MLCFISEKYTWKHYNHVNILCNKNWKRGDPGVAVRVIVIPAII